MNMNLFDAQYFQTPPWDIGKPQDAFVSLFNTGRVAGRVLDIGCGTGDLSIFASEAGHETWGVDLSARAIAMAAEKTFRRPHFSFQGKINGRGVYFTGPSRLTLAVGDALELWKLPQDNKRPFDTVFDSGFFHTLNDEGRTRYVKSLARIMSIGSTLHLMCFSEQEPDWGGPRRVTRRELLDTFSYGWAIDDIHSTLLHSNLAPEGSRAYLMSATYYGASPRVMH